MPGNYNNIKNLTAQARQASDAGLRKGTARAVQSLADRDYKAPADPMAIMLAGYGEIARRGKIVQNRGVHKGVGPIKDD
jgi:hypothetical protein